MPLPIGFVVTAALLGPALPTGGAAPSPAVQQPGEPAAPPPPTERPHKVGLGGFGGSGGGVSFRYFPHAQLGVDVDLAFSGGSTGSRSTPGGATFRVAPSAVFMFTQTHPLWDIDVRPYAGVGFNYAYTSRVFGQTSTSQLRSSGLGMQAFGGAELTFAGVDRIAISAQVAYYRLAVQPVNLLSTSGTDFYLMFHYYMK